MSSATLNLRVNPRRMLKASEAAEYCALSSRQFKAECPVAPVALGEAGERFDMRDLDRWLDTLKGSSPEADAILARLDQ